MKSLGYAAIVVLSCNSCGLMKHTATTSDSSDQLSTVDTELQMSESRNWSEKSAQLYLKKDTGNLEYTVQIWPRGSFSFSHKDGFTGEAYQVTLKGTDRSSSLSAAENFAQVSDRGRVENSFSTNKKNISKTQVKVEKSALSWKWVLAAIISLAILSWLICRILKTN